MSSKKVKNKKKIKKTLKYFIYGCAGIIVIEALLMLTMWFRRETNINYQDTLNDIIEIEDGYIGVGSSNFKNSKHVDKKTYSHVIKKTGEKENIIASQARITKYDDEMNILWEKAFSADYDSVFYSIIEIDDGYIAVGSYIYEYKQIDLNTRDGLIVKYDKNGDVIWYKNYQILGDTSFRKVIQSGEDYIVVGQSIYENMEIGNHYKGGGIIVKYDKDGKVLAENNYGGNKSGLFNDVVEVDDGYIVCGRDATNYGIVVKFKKDFNRLEKDEKLISDKVSWQRTYSYTDTAGFTDLEIKNNKIYLSGSINVSSSKDSQGNILYQNDAAIVIYDIKGKLLDKYTFGGNSLDRYTSMIVNDDNIIVIGATASDDIDIPNYPKYDTQTGIIVKYDMDGNILNKTYFGGTKEDILSKIIKTNDEYLVVGTSNSQKGLLGYDYKVILNTYNKDLEKTN